MYVGAEIRILVHLHKPVMSRETSGEVQEESSLLNNSAKCVEFGRYGLAQTKNGAETTRKKIAKYLTSLNEGWA